MPGGTRAFLIVTAFLGAFGIGLVNPVVPFLAARFAPERDLAFVVSALTMAYAGAAFLAAPVLGAMSDRFGRRPVLVLSVLGSAIGYFVFGAADTLWLLIAGRLIDGFTAGNFSAVFAAVADSTKPEERGRYFGYLGATMGAGIITGPAVGGLLAHFGLRAPFYVAAALCLANASFGALFMPETRPADLPRAPVTFTGSNPFTQLRALFELRALRSLLVVSVLFSLPFAMMTTLLALLGKDRLGWTASEASAVFIAVGVCDIAVQGLLLGKLLARFGERRSGLFGLALAAVGLGGMALSALIANGTLLFASVAAFATGEGIFTACLSALLSVAAGPQAQGRVHGGSQGLQSLTQIAGPLVGSTLYARFHPASPFALGAVLLVGAGVLFRSTREATSN